VKPVKKIESLGPDFYDAVEAAEFPEHILRYKNMAAAARLGLQDLDEEAWVAHFAKFKPFNDSLQKPLALKYHGRQFEYYNPDLGDGRGFLYAQFKDNDTLLDIGTKGSGQTPYSRAGDGRLTLKGAIREVLATEYLQALGVNTSKTLSVVETGEKLTRNDEPSPTRSAVLCRLSHSHIRIGTFQRLAHLGEMDNIKKLLDYTCENYYPQLKSLDINKKVPAFLDEVTRACAETTAEWMVNGFVHGVLNSDNINITGESFDYGPYRFLPHYEPKFVAAYFDRKGLYAYNKQPEIIYWNLQQLAKCFAFMYDNEQDSYQALQGYSKYFSSHLMETFLARLNLQPLNHGENHKLLSYTYEFISESEVPYENFFFDWFGGERRGYKAMSGKFAKYYQGEAFTRFYNQIKVFRVRNEEILRDDYFNAGRACTLYLNDIEKIWADIDQKDNWTLFGRKLSAIQTMVARA